MAEDDTQDQSEKTEEPTQRKLDEALKKGQVASSREINNFLMLFAFGLILLWVIPQVMSQIGSNFAKYIHSPHLIEVSEENTSNIFGDVINNYVSIIAPIIIAALTAALLSGFSQHPPVLAFESIMPKLSKLSPIRGLKKMFSLRAVTEFLKGLFKISLVGLVAYIVLWPMKEELDLLVTFEVLGILDIVHAKVLKIIIGVLTFMAVIAVIDFMYQRYEHNKNLRMSRQDIKEEHKQTEGDPQIKAKLKQIRMERVRKRMMAAVPEADVVITNPTHFAIALKYEERKMIAPIVVAKGMDFIAVKIKDLAKENEIPVVENAPLARALYDAVDIDEEIPIEFYQAVAEVISYVYRLKHKQAA